MKKGRIRIFRVSADGRALTTSVIEPGTIFGEMRIVGQLRHDSLAEALDEVVVCVMTRADVPRLPLAASTSSRPLGRGTQVKLTHEQLAALAGTSRETTSKVLGEYAARGLVSVGRGRISLIEPDPLRRLSGE